MSNVHVYSTLSAPVRYTVYQKSGNDIPRAERSVLIKGGANVADKNFITPRGVVTTISVEELALLEQDKLFQLHVKNGYLVVDKSLVDVDKVVADMEGRDESAPLVPEDFEEEKAPVVPAAPIAPSNKKKRR